MPSITVRDEDRNKPLCYDPERDMFITLDDILSGREMIIRPDSLSRDDRKRLVIRRQQTGPDYTVQSISGPPMTRDDVIEAILRDDEFGRMTVEAEISYLKDFLAGISPKLTTPPGSSGDGH
jgi:hypothetical protein